MQWSPGYESVKVVNEMRLARDRVSSLFERVRGRRSDLALLAEAEAARHRQVAVMSFGDIEATFLSVDDAVTFPSHPDGRWNPAAMIDPLAMCAHLEFLRSQGIDSLVMPKPAEQSANDLFTEHLKRFAFVQAGSATAVDLRSPTHVSDTCLQSIATQFELSNGRPPSVLDLTSSYIAERSLRGVVLSVPPETVKHWIDDTFDFVLTRSGEADLSRLASGSLIAPAQGDVTVLTPLEVFMEAHFRIPTVSIIIPSYDGLILLQSCLRSIRDWVPRWLTCEVLVADDGSTDGSREWVESWAAEHDNRVVFVGAASNRGFLRNCNHAAEVSQGETILFLNNDTVILPGAVEALLRIRGCVSGSRLLFPDGRLQEAGGIVYHDGSAANIGKFDRRPSRPIYSIRRSVAYTSGASLMVPRDVWASLHGFDEHFAPAYYEDTDLCFRARAAGVDVIYQPESNVVHFEGATSGTSTEAGPKRFQLVNQQKFLDRWHQHLGACPSPPNDYGLDTWHALASFRLRVDSE